MKKTFTLCLLVASLVQGYGQFYDSFYEVETAPCPSDSSSTVQVYQHWDMYQTLDGHWDGPKDSTICISLKTTPDEGIDLLTVDLARPIFFRYKFTDDNKIWLQPDWMHNVNVSGYSWGGNSVEFQAGTDCPGNICSGVFVGIEIPTAAGDSTTTMRWYSDIPDGETNYGYFSTCAPTEYFTNNYLREFIIKLFPVPGTTTDQKLKMNYANMEAVWDFAYVDEVIAPQSTYVDTSYNMPISMTSNPNGSWTTNYLLHFTDTNLYPSAATPSYVEGRPEVNTPDPQTINLIVDQWETLVPQPFAFLRGGLVEGSDSVRHHLNLINNGGDICMSGIIDFAFGEDTKYLHAGGHVNLEGMNACMMFRNGGSFELADGVTMQYGQDGRGILALRSGGQLVMGRGSSLLFDGVLWLQGIPTAKHPDPQFYLDLKPGSSLVFGERANVLNANSTAPNVKLNVYMNGGTLDDSQLNPAARLLIHRIYPKPAKRFAENVQVLNNPTLGQFQVDYVSIGQEKVKLEVHDLQGRLVWSKSFDTVQGHNFLDGEFGAAAAGVYVATLSAKGGQVAVKLAKFN